MRNVARLRSSASHVSVLLLCIIAFGLLATAAQKKIAAGSLFAPEKGKFNILLEGKSVGHEDFEIAASGGGWTAHGTTSMKPPQGAASTVSGTLTLQPDGVPMTYEWSSQAEKSSSAHVLFANGVAKMTLQLQGARPYEQDLSFSSPLIVVLDNNLYHQYAVLARVYDWSKRGAQSFPVLIPQELTPGTITVDSLGSVSAEGKSYEGLKVVTNDVEIALYLDGNHRLVRMEVPAAKVSVVRE
ncbi:MAG TPA: hypothetical protein VGF61_07590 [Candidatus Acidoferrum sp.]|jgi:hypothetical protein